MYTCSSPSFLVAFEKRVDAIARLLQRLGPLVEQPSPRCAQLVPALRGARGLGVPLGADQSLGLEGAQGAVEVAHVRAPPRGQLAERVEQLVAMRGPVAEQEQERRLAEPLDPGVDGPPSTAWLPSPSHADHIYM